LNFIRRTQGAHHGVKAVDLGAPTGTPIWASASGVVVVSKPGNSKNPWNGGYGKFVVIEHPNGTHTLYSHMSQIFVKQGEYVKQGQEIGLVGSTGRSTGPHLHFEVWGAHNPGLDNSWAKVSNVSPQ